jgi:hypothetical protein
MTDSKDLSMNDNFASKPILPDQNGDLAKARIVFREELNPQVYRTLLEKMFDPVIGINRFIATNIERFVGFFANLILKIKQKPAISTSPITRSTNPPPFWLFVIFVESLILLLDFSISTMVGEFNGTRVEIIPLELFNVLISFCFILLVKSYFDKLIYEFRFDLVDYVNSIGSLKDIKSWFDCTKAKGKPLLWGLLFSLAWAGLGPILIHQVKGGFLGWGPWVLMILANFFIGTGGYYLWISRNFRIKVKLWDFKIYEPNPSKSLVIMKLLKLLSIPVIIGAFLSVLTTLAFSITRTFSLPILFIAVLCGWYPMLSLFVRNHIALASIITRAKQKKLFELQNRIAELERDGLKSTAEIEYLQKLIDYHDRIASTPNTALNFRITFGFFNTLLFPLETLFITYPDILLKLFRKWIN